jgi:hypothetical protein
VDKTSFDSHCRLNAEELAMIHFACPQCRAKLKAENHKIGRLTRCPPCRLPIEVPRSLGELVPSDRGNQASHEVVELGVPVW